MLMMNNYMCVGRMVSDPEIKELEDGKRICNITLAVPRSYKNAEGEYETDFIDCTLWNNIADNTAEYCQKGDLVGIKGRIETRVYESENGEKRKQTQIIADKVSFLASSKTKVKEESEPEMD